MKKSFLIYLLLFYSGISIAQNPSIVPDWIPNAFTDYIFNKEDIEVVNDVVYENVPVLTIPENTNNITDNAKIDIYFSNTQNQCLTSKPVIILCHGNNETKSDYGYFAMDLARRGYVVACIEYRKNFLTIPQLLDINNSAYHPRVICTGVMDVFNCIKYLSNNAAQYSINPNYFIIGGFSLGAMISLNSAFLDKTELQSYGITWINSAYYNDYDVSLQTTKIKGVFSLAGSVYDLNYIKNTEQTPVFLFHGVKDGACPYLSGKIAYSIKATDVTVYGGGMIAQRLKTNNSSFYFVTAKDVGHNFTPNCSYRRWEYFPNGYVTNWYPDMLSFLKNSVLCNNMNQFHKIVNCTTPDCDILNTTCTGASALTNPSIPNLANLPTSACQPTTTNEHCHTLSFDGGDFIKIPYNNTFDGVSKVIHFWYKKTNTLPSNQLNILFSAGNDLNISNSKVTIGLIGENTVGLYVKDLISGTINSYTYAIPTINNNWHHYAIVLYGTTFDMYIDGILSIHSTISQDLDIPNYIQYIGGSPYNTGTFPVPYSGITGQIDEIRYWSDIPDAFNSTILSSIIFNGINSNICPNTNWLVANWKLNQNTQIIKDETNFHNDAIMGTTTNIETADPTHTTNCNTSARMGLSTTNSIIDTAEDMSIESSNSTGKLYIYPNPSKHVPTVIYYSTQNTAATIEILDAKGEVKSLQKISLVQGDNNLSSFLPKLATGIYQFNIKANDFKDRKQFIIIE